jgi:hypothetical protein
MKRAVLAPLGLPILCLLAACSQPPAAQPSSTPSVEAHASPAASDGPFAVCGPVSAAGWCKVAFGQSPDDAEQAAAVPLVRQIGDGPHDPEACTVMTTAEGPQTLIFLVESNKVGSLVLHVAGPRTAEGIGVGSTEAELMAAYGPRATSAPNKYESETVKDVSVPDGPGKLIFEVEAGKVRTIKAGLPPTVDYVEGCA